MSNDDISDHPNYDLTINQLKSERKKIIEYNTRVSSPDFIFRHLNTFKSISLKGIDKFIAHKKKYSAIQLKLFK